MTDYERQKDAKEKEIRCKGCEYCRPVYASDSWKFMGCYSRPYNGKWIAEVKECPKNGADMRESEEQA